MSSFTKPVRHIRLPALWSQGDVAPYVALGLGLQRAGFDISIGTTATFRSFVESWGLPCVTTNREWSSVVRREPEEKGETGTSRPQEQATT